MPIPGNLADVPRLRRQAAPHDVALSCGGRTTTYRELDARASRVAQGLLAAGLAPGDRIAFLGKNSDSYFEVLFGAAKARVALVVVNWRLAPPEIEHILGDSEARMLFADPDLAGAFGPVLQRLPRLAWTITLGQNGAGGGYATWRDEHDTSDPMLGVAAEDAVLQMYSSGTTGQAKGVVIPHRAFPALRRSEQAMGAFAQLGPGDASLVVMPTFHMLGTGLALTAITAGARCVILRNADAAETLRLIPAEKVTHLTTAPAFLGLLVADPAVTTTDVSSLRVITYAGSPISSALLARARAVFDCDFLQYYGATETTGEVTCLAPNDHLPATPERLRSCGRPIPGVEVRIAGADGAEVATGEVGEIRVRSASLMTGYWHLPHATAEAIVDGWYQTGDAAFRDAEGFITIVDRMKDMIVTGGENVYSAEVEAALSSDPDVADCAVIGVPDEKWGEAVKGIVVVKPGAKRDGAAILARLRGKVAGYKIPKSIDFVDALPRNPSGKILKRELRKPYWSEADRGVA
jgi:acyl-CoA synthetase (AMP-forming)/AMP-acid ligase II